MKKLLLTILVLFWLAQSVRAVVIIRGLPAPPPPDLSDEHVSSIEEELLKPPPIVAPAESAAWKIGKDGKLIRLPGLKFKWPHQGCLMCLGIHLERTHKVPMDHLQKYGREQWDVIHCNLHNEKVEVADPPAVKPPPSKFSDKSGGCSGGSCSSPSRTKWRGMFR